MKMVGDDLRSPSVPQALTSVEMPRAGARYSLRDEKVGDGIVDRRGPQSDDQKFKFHF